MAYRSIQSQAVAGWILFGICALFVAGIVVLSW